MAIYQVFTGGDLETNAYLVQAPEGIILIDAPADCAAWLTRNHIKVDLLLITHGHFDHTMDAADIVKTHHCKVGYHSDGIRMLTEPGFFSKLGYPWDVEPVAADFYIEESVSETWLGMEFQIFLVPGHCAGSLCFLDKKNQILYGGDVLFAGAVGRWDLPGGDMHRLLNGIQSKLLSLGDTTIVCPGHGPTTTIGQERKFNPYLN